MTGLKSFIKIYKQKLINFYLILLEYSLTPTPSEIMFELGTPGVCTAKLFLFYFPYLNGKETLPTLASTDGGGSVGSSESDEIVHVLWQGRRLPRGFGSNSCKTSKSFFPIKWMNPKAEQNRLRASVWSRVRGVLFCGPGYAPDRTKQCLTPSDPNNKKLTCEDCRKKRDHFTKWVEKSHEQFDAEMKTIDAWTPSWHNPDDTDTSYYRIITIGGLAYNTGAYNEHEPPVDGMVPKGDYVEIQGEKSQKGISVTLYGILWTVYKKPSPQDPDSSIIYIGVYILGVGSSGDKKGGKASASSSSSSSSSSGKGHSQSQSRSQSRRKGRHPTALSQSSSASPSGSDVGVDGAGAHSHYVKDIMADRLVGKITKEKYEKEKEKLFANQPDSLAIIDDPQRVVAHRFPPDKPIVAGSWEDHHRMGPNADGPNAGPTIAIVIRSQDKKSMPAKSTSGLHVIMQGEHVETGETWTIGPKRPLQPDKAKMGSDSGRYIFALKPPKMGSEARAQYGGDYVPLRTRDDAHKRHFTVAGTYKYTFTCQELKLTEKRYVLKVVPAKPVSLSASCDASPLSHYPTIPPSCRPAVPPSHRLSRTPPGFHRPLAHE